MELDLNPDYDWTGTGTPTYGSFQRYPGNKNQLVWRAPEGDNSRNEMDLEITVPEGENFCFNHMVLQSLNGGTLYN